MTISVIILTKNEEKNIKDCIASANWSDEVLAIDSGSTDATVDLAQELGAKVVFHPMTEGYAAQRNFALQQTSTDWVMFLDADERITPELAAEIQRVVSSGEQCAYEMPRKNIAFGHWLRYGGWYPDYCLRLYPRMAVKYESIVHERAVVTCPVKKLKQPLDHYTYTDWDRYFVKFNSYTTLMAKQLYDKGKKANLLSIILRPWWAFFRTYILKLGFLDGKMGFIMAMYHAFYTMAKYVKLYYLQEERGRKQ